VKLADATFVVIDTESTGLDFAGGDRVVEVAASLFCLASARPAVEFRALVNPERPIPPEASAIHHLVDRDVADAPTMVEVEPELLAFIGDAVVVAHHAEHDRAFLPCLEARPWICTERLAHHLWPQAPQFKNQTLRYWLGLEVDVRGQAPHRAGADVIVTEQVFRRELEAYLAAGNPDDVELLVEFAARPYVLERMPFGKHRDDPIEAVPTSYMLWCLKNVDGLSSDMRHTFERHLALRDAGWTAPKREEAA
jgi:exodeoxyribonuclease X